MNLMNLLVFISVLIIIPSSAFGCYNSIFSFGDSLTDTGNYALSNSANLSCTCFCLPYGETFFHRATGRCSNGRLIIDFMAEFLGLAPVPPYLVIKHNNQSFQGFESGVNFAVGGATALDPALLEAMGSTDQITNCSLSVQMDWFKDVLSSLCNTSSECSKQLLSSSLIYLGGIGGNDYNHAIFAGISMEVVHAFVPLVVDKVASTIQELIELGASTILVPGYMPIGCLPCFLQHYETSDQSQYNSSTGCLNWLNNFSAYHNQQLQIKLTLIQNLHPHVNIIYADYYNPLLQLYQSPDQFGFAGATKEAACCGSGGGKYNYNSSETCGPPQPGMILCENPAEFISWDGVHPTEAVYRLMTVGLLQGKYASPPIATLCVSQV